MTPAASTKASPWHPGEIAMQEMVGVAAQMDVLGRRFIRDQLVDQHRRFYEQLPFVVLGAIGPDGSPWATIRAGRPGFLSSPDERHLDIATRADAGDPAQDGMKTGEAIGMLGIELHNRRRNRLNGTIVEATDDGLRLAVAESFGNCPQYIQLRTSTLTRAPDAGSAPRAEDLTGVDQAAIAMIRQADTFFVATYFAEPDGRRRVDVSHRGGRPGFVHVDDEGTLTVPDFAGNQFFNTLGNIRETGRAGMVFVDFSSGDLLQITGGAEVVLDSPQIAAFKGAERLWRVRPQRVVRRPSALPLRWALAADGWSPNLAGTGSWDEAEAAARGKAWRPFRVARIVEESETIRSLLLAPGDGGAIAPHCAGQHLPIRWIPEGGEKPLLRTYTISSAPADGAYRISVKREGVISRALHALRVGDMVEARAPAGAFTIDAGVSRPAVLLAAGIGITPMLAMLRHIVHEGLRTRSTRPTWIFQSARSAPERAFAAELDQLAELGQGAVRTVRVLSDPGDARPGKDFDHQGRIDVALMKSVLPLDDYDYYLCGPGPFMQSVYDGLRALSIADDRIYAEAFGPSSLTRSKPDGGLADSAAEPAIEPVDVVLRQSGRQARWAPGAGTLLKLAEANGLEPEFSCRGGSCGSCRTRVLEGGVAYARPVSFPVDEGEALICCAVPAAGARLVLDL